LNRNCARWVVPSFRRIVNSRQLPTPCLVKVTTRTRRSSPASAEPRPGNRLPTTWLVLGLTAPVVAWLLWKRRPWSRRLALRWNFACIADLVMAVTLGVLSAPGPFHRLALADDIAARD